MSDRGPVGGKSDAPTKGSQNGGKPSVGFTSPPGQNTAAGKTPGGFGQNPRRPR